MLDVEGVGSPRFLHMVSATTYKKLAVSSAHPLADREAASLRSFSDEVFFSLTPDVSPNMSERVRQVCGVTGFVPRITEVDSSAKQLEAVESGWGVVIVPENYFGQNNSLIRLLPLEEKFPVKLMCVWDPQNENPCIDDFLTMFKGNEQ